MQQNVLAQNLCLCPAHEPHWVVTYLSGHKRGRCWLCTRFSNKLTTFFWFQIQACYEKAYLLSDCTGPVGKQIIRDRRWEQVRFWYPGVCCKKTTTNKQTPQCFQSAILATQLVHSASIFGMIKYCILKKISGFLAHVLFLMLIFQVVTALQSVLPILLFCRVDPCVWQLPTMKL